MNDFFFSFFRTFWDNLGEQFESRLQDILELDQTIPQKQINGYSIDFDKPVQLTQQDLNGFDIDENAESEAGSSSKNELASTS